MKTKENKIFTFLLLFLIIFSIINLYIMRNSTGTTHLDLETRPYILKQAGFWNNFTFIHITGLNWTIANESDWCSGSGTWIDPYLIENMIINAIDSPIGCGILIENSLNVYFNIKNVTIFGTSNGIKFENTNNGAIINSNLPHTFEGEELYKDDSKCDQFAEFYRDIKDFLEVHGTESQLIKFAEKLRFFRDIQREKVDWFFD